MSARRYRYRIWLASGGADCRFEIESGSDEGVWYPFDLSHVDVPVSGWASSPDHAKRLAEEAIERAMRLDRLHAIENERRDAAEWITYEPEA